MYKLIRIFLVLILLAGLYSATILFVIAWPASGWLVGIALVVRSLRKGRQYLTTLGSARWASASDLRRAQMLDAPSGLIVGRLPAGKEHP